MCGVAGILSFSDSVNVSSQLAKAVEQQLHRGPDIQSSRIFNADKWSLGLSHQRLSILDLSDAGAQPMSTESDSSTIIYNGEVYNYKELMSLLPEDEKYFSSSDTEVLLKILSTYGIAKSLPLLNGMWAFAWLDEKNNKLYLCRDRAGVKPLYYFIDNDVLYFSSEVKAILESSEKLFTLDTQAVGEYLLQSVQDSQNNSFYSEIKAVPAGCYIEIDLSKDALNFTQTRYWNVLDAEPYSGDDLPGHLNELFNDAVRLRMRSDVPIGVTLSGGLDSSAIAASMKKHLGSAENLNVLSAVSPGSKLDESEFIDAMSSYLGAKTHKVELNWTADEAIDLLKTVTWHNDSPVGSFSNVAHYLMMKKASELGITVILSGQGADELLCGYKKYLGFYIQGLIRDKRLFKAIQVFLGFLFNRSVVNQFSLMEAKRYLPQRFKNKDIDIQGPALKKGYKPQSLNLKSGQSMSERQAEDLERFSVPFLTHYEDRMSMAWSREIRLPFLDYRLMELLVNLPTKMKLQKGWTKYILREAMQAMLPDKINWRKDKQGFVNPQEEWLKNELKSEVLNTFSEDALIFSFGLVDRKALLEKYNIFCTQSNKNGQVWYRDIFAPFALEVWLQLNKHYLKAE